MAGMARGAQIPSIPPVWQRELFHARTPPRITCSHHEFQVQEYPKAPSNGSNLTNNDILIQRSFFLGPNEIKAIRKHLPPNFPKHCSQFVLLTACLWKCRTSALNINPEEEVLMCSLVNARGKNLSSALSLPLGYYGNAFVYPAAVTKAEDLSQNSLEYVVELVKKAIAEANKEYFRSVGDFLATKGRPLFKTVGNFLISDNRHVGYEEVDSKWGSPTYAGIATSFPVLSFICGAKEEERRGLWYLYRCLCWPWRGFSKS